MTRNFPKVMGDENLQIYLTLLTTTSTYSWLDTVTWNKYQKQGKQEIQLACKGIAIRPTTRYSPAAMRARCPQGNEKNNSTTKIIQLPK